MVFLRTVFAATLIASLSSGLVLAQTPSMPVAAGTKVSVPEPNWLSPGEVSKIVASVPPPPATGSPADQADLKTEIEVQNTRTPARSQQAVTDATIVPALFLDGLEPAVSIKNDPKFYFLFHQLHRQTEVVNKAAKQIFKRLRPFVAHPDVIHPLGTIDGYSYPSGHSTAAFCDAVVLGRIFPEHAAQFLDIAKRIAESRVVMGVHYTTDIREGERDGREIARVLLTKPEFLARLDKVKAEVSREAVH